MLFRCLFLLWVPCTWAGDPAMPRLVTLAPSLSETTVALGAAAQLVGVTDYCLLDRDDVTRIGGYLNPNLEQIVSLEPDLVLALPEHRDVIEKLTRLGLRVEAVRNWSVSDILGSVSRIGALIGREEEARMLRAKMEQRQTGLTRTPAQRPGVLLVLGNMGAGARDTDEVFLVGRNGFLNEILALAGGSNVWRKDKPFFPKVGREGLLGLAPDVIIELLPHDQVDPELLAQKRRAWEAIPFLKGRKSYHVVHADHVLQAGPRYLETLAQMVAILDAH